MRILTADFESFWDADYTLSKMTTEAYVRDPRFKAHMLGIKNGDKQPVVVPTHRIQPALDMVPWKETAILCQHTHFDGLILSHHYGVVPAFYMDTLSMFRALYPAESASLDNQTKVLGLPPKGNGYNVVNTKGIHTLSPAEYRACATYCALDCDLTWRIFNLLKAHFPLSEMRLIDLIIRLFTDPVLRLNPELLQEAWHDERMATLALFQRALPQFAKEAEDAIERDDTAAWKKLKTPLSSNPQFARMLYNLGIDPPKKISPAAIKSGKVTTETAGFPPEGLIPEMTKEEKLAAKTRPEGAELHPSEIWAYAFSKSDEGFKHLLGSDDPLVPLLVEARLGVKSTIKETRAQRFMSIASRGTFPIYLLYYGGHTGRLSGGDKINAQNLNKFCPAPWCDGGKVDAEKLADLQYNNHYRGDLPECDDPECPKCHGTGVSPLRRAIEAPPGHVIVVRDLSGIEARVNAWLCGQDDMVDTFRRREDVYCEMASTITGREITKKDKLLRFLGKAVVLGCIAEGELVLTDRGLAPIENVSLDMRVWDGVEFVTHTGVIYQGDKEVMTYDGLTATPDHIVFMADGTTCELQIAAETGNNLALTGVHGAPIRLTGDMLRRCAPKGEEEHNSYSVQVPSVRFSQLGGRAESKIRQEQGVRPLLPSTPKSKSFIRYTWKTVRSDNTSVPEPEEPIMEALRWEGDRVPFYVQESVHPLGGGEFAASGLQRSGDRPSEQRRPLRAGEFTTGNERDAADKPTPHQLDVVQGGASSAGACISCCPSTGPHGAVCATDHVQSGESGAYGRRDHRPIPQPPKLQTKRTYDITNAGPRHRFTVSGKLVHNCGYGLGYKKFQSMLRVGMLGMPSILLGWDIADALGVNVEGFKHKNAGYINESLPPGVDFDTHALHCACADKIIRAFRDNKPKIPEFWQSCQNALGSILRGEVVELGTNGVVRTCREGFVLPNGMKIRYTELEAKAQGKRVEYSILKNRRKGERAKVYGGLCTENLVQALARIILTDAFTEMHRQGIRVVHQVHDEILAVCPESDAERVYEQMGRIMSTPPKWAPDLPLASEGGWDRVYIK